LGGGRGRGPANGTQVAATRRAPRSGCTQGCRTRVTKVGQPRPAAAPPPHTHMHTHGTAAHTAHLGGHVLRLAEHGPCRELLHLPVRSPRQRPARPQVDDLQRGARPHNHRVLRGQIPAAVAYSVQRPQACRHRGWGWGGVSSECARTGTQHTREGELARTHAPSRNCLKKYMAWGSSRQPPGAAST
jgi:hypothetical protein